MSKTLATLIGSLGAGLSGYAAGRNQFEAGERRKLQDSREDEEYERVKGERADAKRMKTQLIDSQKDIEPEIVTQSGATYGNDEALAQDSRELNRMHAATGAPAPQLEPASYTVDGKSHATRAAADGAMVGMNSQSARDKRAAKVYRDNGDLDRGRQYDEYARKAIDEGTDEVLGSISASAPTIEAIKKAGGKLTGAISPEAIEAFNGKGGKWKINGETTVEHFIEKDAAGREVVNSRVLGAGGRPIVEDVRTAGMMLMDAKTRLQQKNTDTSTFQAAQQITETARAHKATEDDRRLTRQQSAAQHAQNYNLRVSENNAARQDRQKQTLAGKLQEIEDAVGVKLSVDERKKLAGLSTGKLPPKDKEALFDKMVEEFAKGNPDAKLIAGFSSDLRKSFGAIETNGQIEGALREDFGKHEPGSPGYAATYAAATEKLRLTPAQLHEMGYPAPAKTKQARAAQGGTSIAAPTAQRPGTAPVPGSSAAKLAAGVEEFRTPRQIQQRNDMEGGREAQQIVAQAMATDPELRQLDAQMKAAMGNNDRVGVNNIMAKIEKRKAAFGQ